MSGSRTSWWNPDGPSPAKPYFYFGYENGRPTLNVKSSNQSTIERHLERADIDPEQSILAQRRDPDTYPELSRIADLLRQILIYRSWQFGPDAMVRGSCRADVRTESRHFESWEVSDRCG